MQGAATLLVHSPASATPDILVLEFHVQILMNAVLLPITAMLKRLVRTLTGLLNANATLDSEVTVFIVTTSTNATKFQHHVILTQFVATHLAPSTAYARRGTLATA